MVRTCILVIMVLFMAQPSLGFELSQAQPATTPPAEDSGNISFGPKRQIATIVYCGLAGAVLGLSTLSFYGRPQDYLSNIAIGFGAGVIIGTIYTTWNAATNPDDFYGATLLREEERDQAFLMTQSRQSPFQLSHTWTF